MIRLGCLLETSRPSEYQANVSFDSIEFLLDELIYKIFEHVVSGVQNVKANFSGLERILCVSKRWYNIGSEVKRVWVENNKNIGFATYGVPINKIDKTFEKALDKKHKVLFLKGFELIDEHLRTFETQFTNLKQLALNLNKTKPLNLSVFHALTELKLEVREPFEVKLETPLSQLTLLEFNFNADLSLEKEGIFFTALKKIVEVSPNLKTFKCNYCQGFKILPYLPKQVEALSFVLVMDGNNRLSLDLTPFSKLRTLAVTSCILELLSKDSIFSRLEKLDLTDSKLTNDASLFLPCYTPNLTHLNIDTNFSNRFFLALQELSQLEVLFLKGYFGEASVLDLDRLSRLKSFSLNIVFVNVTNCPQICSSTFFPYLTSLAFEIGKNDTNIALRCLKNAPHLTKLTVKANHLKNEILKELPNFQKLKKLELSSEDFLEDFGIGQMTTLTNVKVKTPKIDFKFITDMIKLPNLKHLEVNSDSLSNDVGIYKNPENKNLRYHYSKTTGHIHSLQAETKLTVTKSLWCS